MSTGLFHIHALSWLDTLTLQSNPEQGEFASALKKNAATGLDASLKIMCLSCVCATFESSGLIKAVT